MSRVFIVGFPMCLMINTLMNCRVKVRRKRLALLGICLGGLYPPSNEDLLILRKYFFVRLHRLFSHSYSEIAILQVRPGLSVIRLCGVLIFCTEWNEELLYVGGFLARLVYEKEIEIIRSTWPKDALTNSPAAASSNDEATYAMHYFTFNTSTPDGKVSKILEDVFFKCSKSESFPILSNSGIRDTKDVRQPNGSFSSFMKVMPVLIPAAPGDPPSLIDSLPERYTVRTYTFEDVVSELRGRTLQDDEMVGLLRWWVDVYETVTNHGKTLSELKEATKSYIGHPKREISLVNIFKFVDSNIMGPQLQPDDALPPDTIPLSFTRALPQGKIGPALSWKPMTVVDWLSHLISPQIDSAYDIRTNHSYSNRVIALLANIWGMLSKELKSKARKLMEDVPWIATNDGLRRGSEAYFQEADVFCDLPVITASLFNPEVETVLVEFGVKKYLDFDELITKCVNFYGLHVSVSDYYLGQSNCTSGRQ
jgi:hypothetical protein